MKKFLILVALSIQMSTICSSQTISQAARNLAADSIKRIMLEQAALRTPTLRQIYISTDIISKGDIESKLHDNLLFKGKASTIRTTAIFNVPLKSWGKNSVSATFTYFQQELRVTDLQSFHAGLGNEDLKLNKGTVGLTASFQSRDSLFQRPVYYILNASGVTDDFGALKKLSFLGTAVMPLKQSATTRYSAGLILNIDPSIKIPVFPLFTYWHKFKNNIEANIGLPTGMNLRKEVFQRLSVTLGNTISGSLAFLNLNNPNLPNNANYTTIDLKKRYKC
jgi:hypothetical protein